MVAVHLATGGTKRTWNMGRDHTRHLADSIGCEVYKEYGHVVPVRKARLALATPFLHHTTAADDVTPVGAISPEY
jgi:hypothetical protein